MQLAAVVLAKLLRSIGLCGWPLALQLGTAEGLDRSLERGFEWAQGTGVWRGKGSEMKRMWRESDRGVKPAPYDFNHLTIGVRGSLRVLYKPRNNND